MDNNKFEIGKSYKLNYRSPWDDYDIKDIRVTAVTAEEQAPLYGVDSIYSEFFSRYDIGLSTYVTMMEINPEIYVCEIIENRYPIEVNESTMLIPKAIIDFNKTEELLVCDNISIKINGLIAYNDLVYDRGEYLKKLTSNIKKVIKNTDEYGDTPVDLEIETNDMLKLKSEYDKYIQFKNESNRLRKIATEEIKSKHNVDLRLLNKKSNDLDALISSNQLKSVELEDQISLYISIKDVYNDMISSIQNSVNTLFSGLDDGSIEVGDETYNTHKNNIINGVNSE